MPEASPYGPSPAAKELVAAATEFLAEHVYPAEAAFLEEIEGFRSQIPRPQSAVMEALKGKAPEMGLWNLFLPHEEPGHTPLANVDYAHIAELTGRSPFLAPEAMNCSAPDTGNMELLALFGSPAQKTEWLEPLLAGEIRSSFAMTEPNVASSDAGNVATTISVDGDELVISGRKWWITGAGRERTKVLIVLGASAQDGDRHQRHSMVLVPIDTPGIKLVRDLTVFGHHSVDTHMEVVLSDVRVPRSNLLGDLGGGFAMAQARLGPGRIHHCMRLIGMAERGLELMIARASERSTFGKELIDRGVVREWIADARIAIDQARLYTLNTAHLMDTAGNISASTAIAGIKVAVPNMAAEVLDRAMQLHGSGGFGPDTPLPYMWIDARSLRMADGPDEIHRRTVARSELRAFRESVDPEPRGLKAHIACRPNRGSSR